VPGRRDGPVWDVGLDLNMADISAVEVYPRPAVLPIEYNGLGVCAVTLVWPGWSRAVLPPPPHISPRPGFHHPTPDHGLLRAPAAAPRTTELHGPIPRRERDERPDILR